MIRRNFLASLSAVLLPWRAKAAPDGMFRNCTIESAPDAPSPAELPPVSLYVSSSQGDDSRTFSQAQNPATPYATMTHALREGSRNNKRLHVHLLRGDTFTAGESRIRPLDRVE